MKRYVEFLETCCLYTFDRDESYSRVYYKGDIIALESLTESGDNSHLNFRNFTYLHNVPNYLFKVIHAD